MMRLILEDIKRAKENIRDVIRATEVDKSFSLSAQLGSNIYLKYENQQFTGSFKLR